MKRFFILCGAFAVVASSCKTTEPKPGPAFQRVPQGGFSSDDHQPRTPIEHVVFIVKENRTFDHYFGKFPGAQGTHECRVSFQTDPIPMGKLRDRMKPDINHSWKSAKM